MSTARARNGSIPVQPFRFEIIRGNGDLEFLRSTKLVVSHICCGTKYSKGRCATILGFEIQSRDEVAMMNW